jgi:protein-L-isoaspartate(D-aspartate) O-methyltransferase
MCAFGLMRISSPVPLYAPGFLVLLLSAVLTAQTRRQFDEARRQMVEREIVAAGVTNERVVAAMRETPRHEFVPRDQRRFAYLDRALPIGHGQTISPPFVVAFMTEQLDPQPRDRVLEIGTGSGYQAAVLSPLVEEVYTIEIVEPLGRTAQRTLERLDYKNVHVKIGDGFQGWAEHAPFDKIIVTCSPQNVPQPLVEQLRDGGRMVIPVGDRFQQTLYLFKKVDGKLQQEELEPTFFVPMTGAAERLRVVKVDPTRPELVNGSFERTVGEQDRPEGWYYLRAAAVEEDRDAPQGKRAVVFSNTRPGGAAQALQAFGIDGEKVPALDVSLWVRGRNIRAGRSQRELPRLRMEFYDEGRARVGQFAIGPWEGTFEWTPETARCRVPPNARIAVVQIGLLGATGQVAFDDVQVHAAGQGANSAAATNVRQR